MGDVKATIEALLPLVKPKKSDRHLRACLEKARDAEKELNRRAERNKNMRPLAPEYVTSVLNEIAAEDAIFTVDTGMPAVWAARYLRMTRDRRLIGSFKSWVHGQRHAAGHRCATGLSQTASCFHERRRRIYHADGRFADAGPVKNPNFAKMAEAAGVRGFRVEDSRDLKDSLAKALQQDGPALVDVMTNPNELAMPPKLEAKEVAGYGLYFAKQTLHGRLFESIDEVRGNLP
jgi:pyruvate dehydrogenase (quinone)